MTTSVITKRKLSLEEKEEFLSLLRERFKKNRDRHSGIEWAPLEAKLNKDEEKLWSLHEMEITGGEPDVVSADKETGEHIFMDCSAESPSGRRNLCFDHEALESRKEHKPQNSALNLAYEMGVELLTEEQYRELQMTGKFDTKTSSWIMTPPSVRSLGGALFGDRRYDRVFIYHNGAESYYAVRGFRAVLRV